MGVEKIIPDVRIREERTLVRGTAEHFSGERAEHSLD
jgi:hypothetical protein